MTPPYRFPQGEAPAHPPLSGAHTGALSQPERQLAHFVLDQDTLSTLLPKGTAQRWRSGQELAHYGQRMEHVSICLSGQYKVLLNSIDGQTHFVRRLTQGEMFGVPSALADAPFPTDVVCEEAGETLRIARPVLLQLLRDQPDLALNIIKTLATRVAEMFDLMEAQMLPSLRARVYQRLQRLAQFNGRPDHFGHIELPLTHNEIAQSLHASRPRVQQELKQLEREGLIRLGYRRITFLQGTQ